jgi:hypothetical protein
MDNNVTFIEPEVAGLIHLLPGQDHYVESLSDKALVALAMAAAYAQNLPHDGEDQWAPAAEYYDEATREFDRRFNPEAQRAFSDHFHSIGATKTDLIWQSLLDPEPGLRLLGATSSARTVEDTLADQQADIYEREVLHQYD